MSNIVLDSGTQIVAMDSTGSKGVPSDARGMVDYYEDIKGLPMPYVNMKVIVNKDSLDNSHQKGEYVVTKLTELGDVDETGVIPIKDYIPETDPTVPAHVKAITQQNITDWNGKQDAISSTNTLSPNSIKDTTMNGKIAAYDNNGVLGSSGIDTTNVALKSEMSITDGTGADAGTATIQLKSGTSKKVLTQHQSLDGKVDKVTGKGLSTYDYDNIEKGKVDNAIQMPSGATSDKVLGYENGTVAWVAKPFNGKSAYQIWYEENEYHDPTTYNEDYFLASLKAQFGSFVPAEYGTDGKPNDGTNDITASADTTNNIYLVDNLASSPTAKTMWITIVDNTDPQNPLYSWTSIGNVRVNLTLGSGQAVSGVYIKKANGEIESGTANVLSEDATNIKIAGNSRLVKFVGNGNTYVYGNTSIPLQSGKVYRFNVLNPNFDRSNVTSQYSVLEILAYNKKDRTAANKQLILASVANANTVGNYYDAYLPTSYESNSETINVREWYVLIGGRANEGEEVRTLILDYEEPTNYFEYDAEYTNTGQKKVTSRRFNLLKGHKYKISIQDSTSQNISYRLNDNEDSQIFNDVVVSNAASYTFTADKDYIGCFFRFYLAYENTSFKAIIEDVSIKELQDTCEQLDERVTALETDTPTEEETETDSTIAVKDLTEGAVDFRAIKGGEPIASNNTTKRIPLSSGVTYTIKIWSNSGITSTAGTSESYTIEIYRGQTGALYRLNKNSEFVERTLTITPSSDDYIYVPTARFGSDETLYVAAIDTSKYGLIVKGEQQLAESDRLKVDGNLTERSGYVSTTFTVNKNASHSSENNKIDISKAPKGCQITVVITCKSGTPRSLQSYVYTSYGTYNDLGGLSNFSFIKDDDYTELGVYVAAGSVDSATYEIVAKWSSVLVVDNNNGDIVSCNRDAINNIKAAKTKCYVDVDSDNNPVHEYSNYGNNGFNCYFALLQMTDTHVMDVSGTLRYADINRAFDFANRTGLIDAIIHTGDLIEDPHYITRTNSASTPLPSSGYTNGKTQIKEVWAKRVIETSIPTLAIAGNHEFTTQYPLYDSEVTDLLYSDDIVSHVGAIHGTGDNDERKNYYYKDLTKTFTLNNKNTNNTKTLKLRIIGLYQFEWAVPRNESGAATYYETHGGTGGKNWVYYTQEQINWFVNVLASTPTDTPVIILSHYHLSACKHTDSVYNRPNKRSTSLGADDINSFMSENPYFFYQILNAWINGGDANGTFTLQQKPSNDPNGEDTNNLLSVTTNFNGGGKFVANICGHTHSGGMMYFVDEQGDVQDGNNNTNKMPIIMSPCSTSRDIQNTGWWARESNNASYNKLADCLNVIVYDDDADKVKVIRVGSAITAELNEIKTYVF